MLFKQRKPRRFSYKSRQSKLNEEDAKEEDFKLRWREMRAEGRSGANSSKRLIVWVVALGMIIVLWYILGNYQN